MFYNLYLKHVCWHAWTQHARPTLAGQRRTGRSFWPFERKPWLHRIFAFAGKGPLTGLLCWAEWEEEEEHPLVRETIPGAYLLSLKVYKQI